MGGSQRAENIPFKLEAKYQRLTTQGQSSQQAYRAIFNDIVTNVDKIITDVLNREQASGSLAMKKYMRYLDEHATDIPLDVADQVRISLAELGIALCAYSHSTNAQSSLTSRVTSLIKQLGNRYTPTVANELNDFIRDLPSQKIGNKIEGRTGSLRRVISEGVAGKAQTRPR